MRVVYAVLQMHRWLTIDRGPGVTTLSGGTVQQPYGRYRLEPTSPTSVESMRMVTLRVKLDTNMVQGENRALRLMFVCCMVRCYVVQHVD